MENQNQNPERRPYRSALDVVREGRWKEMFQGADPLVRYQQTFQKKRMSNTLIGLGVFSFVVATFFYTMNKMGQEDLETAVDSRGYLKKSG
mmetsp:Transcript_24819/g.42383  ORF Transcript_24819/g.42383 Transcript_24819/m.42383 type:complete len:91 (+) Transcript_24819:35-307(+)